MHILVASSSAYRQELYREAIEGLGHAVLLARGGVECVQRLRERCVDVLVLEAPLQWGGSDGVLDIVQSEATEEAIPVVLVAVGSGTIDWFQLSRFRVDDFLFRLPTAQELGRAIEAVTSSPARRPAGAVRQTARSRYHEEEPAGDWTSQTAGAGDRATPRR